MNDEEKKDFKGHFVPLYEFFIHLVIGSIIFAAIAGFAVGLGELIVWMNIKDDGIRKTLFVIKYVIFATDCLLYGVFLLSSAIHTGKRLWKH